MNLLSLILLSIPSLIDDYAKYDKEKDYDRTMSQLGPDLNFPRIKTYDFIVVGGGTAGSLIAGRLSEKFNVLLLESGGNPVPATDNQFLIRNVRYHPTINDMFSTVPQTHCFQETGGIFTYSIGRMLGGSGSHNGNVFNRGSPHDWNNFAKITGDSTWTYQNVLKHFKNIERMTGELINENERAEFYGDRGPLTVETKNLPINSAWFQSARELGYTVADPNGNQTESFTPIVWSMVNGERQSTYKSFVKPFRDTRRTLTVLTYSEVEQVLINASRVAYGVLYRRHGIIQIAHASKEVIISAGTFSSPMLLMKSGIGSREVLEEAKIPVVINLKGVGKNLRDHGGQGLSFTANRPNTTVLITLDETDVEEEIRNFHEGKGFMSIRNSAQAFFVSSIAKANERERNWPDQQLIPIQLKPSVSKGLPQKIEFYIHAFNCRMKSFGEVRLNTTAYLNGDRDDTKLAVIDLPLFSVPSDASVLIEAINLALKIVEETTPFQKMDAVYTDESPEKCRHLTFRSLEYWQCCVRQRAAPALHPVGTCSMGKSSDPLAVVDSKLRVRGIRQLRIVDASVMPRVTNANINPAVMLVAEKASRDILSAYPVNSGSSGCKISYEGKILHVIKIKEFYWLIKIIK